MNLPRDEVMELRWLQDRIRLIQLEAQVTIQQHQARITAITDGWKERYEISDLKDYELQECTLVERSANGSSLRDS